MIFYILGIILIILDQITKLLVINKFVLGESIPIVNGLLYFTYVRNPGIAFGLFPNINTLVIALSIFTTFLLFYIYKKTDTHELWTKIAIIFIISGAIGNLFDRVQYSVVIDFIDFRIWPVFNIADAYIVIGVFIIFAIMFFTKEPEEGKKDASDTFSIRAD